jgi:hypothetical protein
MRKLGVAAEPLRHRFERLEQTIDALGERLEPLLIVDGLQLDFDAKGQLRSVEVDSRRPVSIATRPTRYNRVRPWLTPPKHTPL